MGDFNLDYNWLYDVNYAHRDLFLDFDEILNEENLNQTFLNNTRAATAGDFNFYPILFYKTEIKFDICLFSITV